MAVKHLLVFFAIGLTIAAAQNVDDALGSLPQEFQGKVSGEQVNALQNKTTKAFRERCEKNGGAGTYDKVEDAFKSFTTCVQGLVNKEQLEKEIEDAKPTGQVDEVFKKYCAKTPSFKKCFFNMTEAARPCFAEPEQPHLKTVSNITEQLAEFICFKEGDRIALFIAEHGPECLEARREQLQGCLNATFGDDLKLDTAELNVDSLPTITFGEKQCGQLSQLQSCVVSELERCEQPTAANIVESLFKFARHATPCKDIPDPADKAGNKKTIVSESKPNSASSAALGAAAAAAVLLARLA